MGKKKAQGKVHVQSSFEQLVAKANREALKPYIHELFMDLGNDLSQRVFRQLANIQTRIMALEEILTQKLGVSEAEIQLAVANIEDSATGHQKVDRPAQAGDLLRVTLETKDVSAENFSAPIKREIQKLMSVPFSLTETVEGALVGASVGDVREVTLDGKLQVRITIDRISEAPAPKAVPQQATNPESENESANA